MIPIDLTGLRGPRRWSRACEVSVLTVWPQGVVLRCTPSHGVIADWYVMHPLVLIYACGVLLNPKCD